MRRSRRTAILLPLALSLAASLSGPRPARAQALLWDPVRQRPTPNLIVGLDTSVTMQVSPGCDYNGSLGCHSVAMENNMSFTPAQNGWAWNQMRIYRAAEDVVSAMSLFKDEFVYGGFRYDTCGPNLALAGHSTTILPYDTSLWDMGVSEITYLTPPDATTPAASYSRVLSMVEDVINESDSGPSGPTGFLACERGEGGYGAVGTPNGAVPATDNCGNAYFIPGRQQVAICAAIDPTSTYPGGSSANIGQAILAQPDNIVHGGLDACRENISVFITDGALAVANGVDTVGAEATTAAWGPYAVPPYKSSDGSSNAFVLLTSNPVNSDFQPDVLATALGQATTLPATDRSALINSLIYILNRSRQGYFVGANSAMDSYGTRQAITSFWIPGTPRAGQAAYPDQSYLGRPMHLSWVAMDPTTGLQGATVCETDWSSRAGFSGRILTAQGTLSVPPPAIEAAIGPPLMNETWLDGKPILASIPDNGTSPWTHLSPGTAQTGGSYTIGYMLNGGQTQAVVVDAPHDVGNPDPSFSEFEIAHATRDRIMYTMAGGYLYAYNAGTYTPLASPADVNGVGVLSSYAYDDSTPTACTERFRYLPGWINDEISAPVDPLAPASHVNLILPQMYTNGQIRVREARVAFNGNRNDYATLLVMTEGARGSRFAALDVSEPDAPAVLGEWGGIPGDVSSLEPEIYAFPGGQAASTPTLQTVVVMPGGDGGAAHLSAFLVTRAGISLLSQVSLPAGNYPTEAVCFDGVSRGSISDCVVLSEAGSLVRVPVGASGQFGTPIDLSPSYLPTLGADMAGRKFLTRPVVYFTSGGDPAYVFGSGNAMDLSHPPALRDNLFKVVDKYPHGGATTAVGVCGTANGVIPFNSAAEMMINPPIVAKGIVSYSTYAPRTNGCNYGTSNLYMMDAETCLNATTTSTSSATAAQPLPAVSAAGIGLAPQYVRNSNRVLMQTSTEVASVQVTRASGVGRSNQTRWPIIPLYWRTQGRTI